MTLVSDPGHVFDQSRPEAMPGWSPQNSKTAEKECAGERHDFCRFRILLVVNITQDHWPRTKLC